MKDSSKTSVTLQWLKPDYDGGSTISDYIIEKKLKDEEWSLGGTSRQCEFEVKKLKEHSNVFFRVAARNEKGQSDFPIVECAHKVLHLTEDMEYEFRVMAVNDAGVGAPSTISMPIKAAEPKDIPCAPSVVCVSDSTNNSISLEWTKPANDGGMEILGYIIEMVKGKETEWKKINEQLVAQTNYIVTGLETGAEYKFRVAAVNHVGRGEDKETPEPAQAVDRLTPPQVDIDATFKQTHIVKAGGSVCLGIQFRGKPIPTATWMKEEGELGVMSEITNTDGYSFLSIENCSRNDTGKYTVNLENASGSKAITFTLKVMDTPGPPQAVVFKEVSRGSVTLTWEPPLNDGGARILHYIVERREASRRTWQQSGGKCTQNILKIQDLLEGVPYFFRVSAENQYGMGEALEMTEPVIATAEPASPKRMDILDTTDNSVVLGWPKPEHDGGSRIHFTINVPISGRPAPKVTWKLEEMRLKNTDRVSIRVTRDKSTINSRGASEPKELVTAVTVQEQRGNRHS
uniref:Titin n=1 Tax=Mola mola TaxID=94237 RepID=A0A3Q4BN68_MOLML